MAEGSPNGSIGVYGIMRGIDRLSVCLPFLPGWKCQRPENIALRWKGQGDFWGRIFSHRQNGGCLECLVTGGGGGRYNSSI